MKENVEVNAQPTLLKPTLQCACPFHEDKGESGLIHAAKYMFHCFACGAHGSARRIKQNVWELNIQ